jgi:excinuclease ABC subunit A
MLISDGHTILIVEHNLNVIRACDFIIDLGPWGGCEGGEVVATGSLKDILESRESRTGEALRRISSYLTAYK